MESQKFDFFSRVLHHVAKTKNLIFFQKSSKLYFELYFDLYFDLLVF